MFKSIRKIQSFGVFVDFTKTTDFANFKEKNIIYGWNYSGKTTFSRIFSSIENKILHEDYLGAKFTIEKDDNSVLSEQNLSGNTQIVRVFNSDFIDKNLSWNGESFNSILLLGKDSIDAERKIEENEKKIDRCRFGYKRKSDSRTHLQQDITELKTSTAKQIKTTLHIIEAYTAAHLNKTIKELPNNISDALLNDNDISNHLIKALSKSSDRLNHAPKLATIVGEKEYFDSANKKLTEIPKFSAVIDYLRDNPKVSDWVEQGLKINEGKNTCEFCGGNISEERLHNLTSHFSKDLLNYKSEVTSLITSGTERIKSSIYLDASLLYPEFRDTAKDINTKLELELSKYNAQIEEIVNHLQKKIDNPFTDVKEVSYNKQHETNINQLISKSNQIILLSNTITDNFEKEKNNSLKALKQHYAASFIIDNDIIKKENQIKLLENHKNKYHSIADTYKNENQILEASISKAQKGREQLNEYITTFLGRSEIQIEVVDDNGAERFKLTRDGHPAKNLSEGEKSAIAFSFFLTKLGELKELKSAIVYIDDPISSLDSNHIFQINALIKDFFFKKSLNHTNNNEEWNCTCKQIFISTHNFEFFSLLKELPLAKKSSYYQIKRIDKKKCTIVNLPKSIEKYSSEYHYLFSIIHKFHTSDNKNDIEILLSIPNAVRRFVELYTYSRIPSFSRDTVDQRAEQLFGTLKSKRILKVLHYFSHLNNIERLVHNTDLICDIENAVTDIIEHLKNDELHYNALVAAIS